MKPIQIYYVYCTSLHIIMYMHIHQLQLPPFLCIYSRSTGHCGLCRSDHSIVTHSVSSGVYLDSGCPMTTTPGLVRDGEKMNRIPAQIEGKCNTLYTGSVCIIKLHPMLQYFLHAITASVYIVEHPIMRTLLIKKTTSLN